MFFKLKKKSISKLKKLKKMFQNWKNWKKCSSESKRTSISKLKKIEKMFFKIEKNWKKFDFKIEKVKIIEIFFKVWL